VRELHAVNLIWINAPVQGGKFLGTVLTTQRLRNLNMFVIVIVLTSGEIIKMQKI